LNGQGIGAHTINDAIDNAYFERNMSKKVDAFLMLAYVLHFLSPTASPVLPSYPTIVLQFECECPCQLRKTTSEFDHYSKTPTHASRSESNQRQLFQQEEEEQL
jgi:hypothetical protein